MNGRCSRDLYSVSLQEILLLFSVNHVTDATATINCYMVERRSIDTFCNHVQVPDGVAMVK